MVNTKRMPAIASVLLVIAYTILGLNPIFAQQAQNNQNKGSGLSISPTRTELNINRGQSDKLEINIKNVTSGPIVAKPFFNDFESDEETGEPKLYKDSNQHSSASVSPFVKGLEDVPLAAGENRQLTYAVNIPNDAAPGGYYSALTFRAVPAGQTGPKPGEVALTANVSSLVLVEVPGNITEQIQILAIKAYKGDKGGSFFVSAPNKVGITIRNQGNSFAKPFGTVSVTDMFGKEVYKYEVNNLSPRGNILPKSTRIFKDELKNIKKPGRYTVTANISYGSGGEILVQKASIWYIPSWLLITLIILIGGLLLVAYLIYKKRFGERQFKKKKRS